MSKFEARNIRNIAIVGHSGEGKTSLAEAMLFNGKSIDRLGRTSDGNTVMDYDEQEIAKKISISLSVAYTVWRDTKINIIDVPGFYDFEGEAEEAMRAATGAVLVADANGAVSVGAEKWWITACAIKSRSSSSSTASTRKTRISFPPWKRLGINTASASPRCTRP